VPQLHIKDSDEHSLCHDVPCAYLVTVRHVFTLPAILQQAHGSPTVAVSR